MPNPEHGEVMAEGEGAGLLRPGAGTPAGLEVLPAGAGPITQQRTHLGSSRYGYTYRRFLLVADTLALIAAAAIAIGATGLANRDGYGATELTIFAGFVVVWILLGLANGLYHLPERKIQHGLVDEFGPVFMTTTVWIWLYECCVALAIPGGAALDRAAALWACALVTVLAMRALARLVARGRSWYQRSVVLVGDHRDTEPVLRRIRRHPEWGLEVVAKVWVDPRGSVQVAPLAAASSSPARAFTTIEPDEPDQLADAIAALGIDRAIVAGGSSGLVERTELTRALAERQLCVDHISGEPESLYASAVLHYLEGLPVMTIQPARLWRGSLAIKRAFDLSASVVGLLLLSPFFAYWAARIKLDSPGPVFFRQPRVGRDGDVFEILKFRTMVDGADQDREAVRPLALHGSADLLKVVSDPRVTRFGGRLRRWSFDELPQLWNVARGEMSLVGPRPLPVEEAARVHGHFLRRTRVRPGMTGPWQTLGRSQIPFDDMVKLDYMYVANWTLREDLTLLARTIEVVARGRGAY